MLVERRVQADQIVVAELPVLEIVSTIHIRADLTLGLGTVVHDYMQQPARGSIRTGEKALVF